MTIKNVLQELSLKMVKCCNERYTGMIRLNISMNQGGIRNIKIVKK